MKTIVLALMALAMAACSRNGGRLDIMTDDMAPPMRTEASSVPANGVDELTAKGYKFVMVMTKNNTDAVLVNKEADNLEFVVAETTCRTNISAKKDPLYEGEDLGVISINCDSPEATITSSASCSSRYPEVQSHFEIKDDKDSYVIDLVCRATAP